MDPIEILYRSHDLLICVKPAGVLSQSGTSGQKSMISLLESQTGCRVYPVHREIWLRKQRARHDSCKECPGLLFLD